MDLFEVSNTNNICKADFDAMVELRGLEVFTKAQVAGFAKSMDSVIKKGETNELGTEEKESVDFAKAELNSLTAWNVVDDKNIKTTVFVRPIQVDIEKGVYKDTHLNKKLGRVGKQWGGKKIYKKVDGIKFFSESAYNSYMANKEASKSIDMSKESSKYRNTH